MTTGEKSGQVFFEAFSTGMETESIAPSSRDSAIPVDPVIPQRVARLLNESIDDPVGSLRPDGQAPQHCSSPFDRIGPVWFIESGFSLYSYASAALKTFLTERLGVEGRVSIAAEDKFEKLLGAASSLALKVWKLSLPLKVASWLDY